jgi:hypothetical protein
MLPCHQSKSTDVALWKQSSEYKARRAPIHTRLFWCPLHHRCKYQAGIRILDSNMEGPDWIQLDRCGEHNANSHDDDQSKYLKHEQIVAVADAVTVAPQQSASQLWRNDAAICSLLQARPSILSRSSSAVCSVLYAHRGSS